METTEKKSGWKFWAGLWMGVAAGLTGGLFLNSKRGKELRKDAGDKIDKISRDINERATEEWEKFSNKAAEKLEESKTIADKTRKDLKKKIKKSAGMLEDAVDKTEMTYEKTADWAVNKLTGKPSEN